MSNYEDKYLKYKSKYLELKNNNTDMIGGGKNNKFILVDGTSSSGKTTICKFFSKKNYAYFQIDNYFNDKRIKFDNIFKKIKNNYGEIDKIYTYVPVKYMVDDAIKTNKNILFDHISQKEIINVMKSKKLKLYIINLFTNLSDMARNLELRRKKGDMRGIFAFNQFSDRYIKCSDNNINKIEIVNRSNFKNLLIKYFKYEFKDKNDLIGFSEKTFSKMNINDDKDHYVKLRETYICDYLLITTNKTKSEIFNELKNNTILSD